ncbi:MAG: 5-formyltetrahydrofolate cyclo-ligase [Lachnospiraceae bacterium]|nr:5-formyltetrahydrofolate cyclo-ligase [Lachnospiraceae bacterium]
MDKYHLRRRMVAAREALAPDVRKEKSSAIISHILNDERFQMARTVMLYRSVRGEVQLDALPALSSGKRYVYPLCVSRTQMVALWPETASERAWKKGAFGIPEPNPAYCREIDPAEIDFVVCPCTSFDRDHNRLGMGAGYYDRFLARCVHADVVAAAFAVQEAEAVPTEEFDYRMCAVITENGAL